MESLMSIELSGNVLNVTLGGKLDAVRAPELMEELKKMSGKKLDKIVFYVSELEYISSAGLRTIIFAKQKIALDSEIFFIAAQEAVLDVIRMSGLDNFLTIADKM